MRSAGSIGVDRWCRASAVSFLLAVAALCVGCASTGPRDEIPLGRWAGEGTFVHECWKDASRTTEVQDIHRSYPTTLDIRRGKLKGDEIVELEIRSKRGSLPDLGDETHLKVALVKTKRVSDTTVLYRMVGLLLNPDAGETYSSDELALASAARCTSVGAETVLQIQYTENFTDTYRFRGRHLEKSGIYLDAESNQRLVHWWEQLTRRK
jgi:hypothetical protein